MDSTRGSPDNWLTTRTGWLAYTIVWLTFASGHAALNLLADEPNYSRAILSALYVVLPAALLGIPIVFATYRISNRLQGWKLVVAHLLGAIQYPIVWVLAVDLIFAVRSMIIGQGFDFRMPPADVLHWHGIAGVLIYASLVAVTRLSIEQRHRGEERQQAKLDLLLAKFDPHFLFNTLHSVRALVGRDAVLAEQALDQLADLLRRVLQSGNGESELVPLREELRFCRLFLALEKLRLADRLNIEENIDDKMLDCLVPAYSLQPIVENAIRHAIAPNPNGGTISLSAEVRGEHLRIIVADTGVGTGESKATQPSGIGLDYVRQRIGAATSGKGRLEICKQEGEGRMVVILLPETGEGGC